MSKQRSKPVASLKDLRYKMAQKLADFENGEITNGDVKSIVGLSGMIINSFKVELFNQNIMGVTSGIDLLIDEDKPKQLEGSKIGK